MTHTDLDDCLDLVADRQRRLVLQHVREKPAEPVAIEELVDAVRRASATDGSQPADRERITVQLLHSHLPKCAEHGIIEYDRDGRAVRYQPNERLESLLDSCPDDASSVSV